MKSSQIILIVIGFILVALMATNPSIEEHKNAIKKELFSSIESDNNSNRNNAQILGEKIGESIGTAIIDRAVNKQNYLLFSFGTFERSRAAGTLDNVTLGLLGQIFLLKKYDKESKRFYKETNREVKTDSVAVNVDANFEKNQINTDNKVSVIGTPIRIGNLEIAQYDFPNRPSWNVAKKLCSDLGEDWRLPTIDELNVLYQNKDKITGLQFRFSYWSSVEIKNNVFIKDLADGREFVIGKGYENYARAVRSF